MNPHRPSEDEIFEQAQQLSGEARAAYLRNVIGDEQLRRHMENLLQANADAGTFLNQPAAASTETIAIATDTVLVIEKSGDKIGRYKLHEQIGEGGCGVVYVAEQEEPVRRRVALKVIKLGMDTKQVIARFEAERQALALMDHPNIAKVLDGGATDTGRPYFVMELVRGIKITDYCDKNNLSTEERLKLFIQVCSAIQHAHQKGIIHRDIKPSNILVTLHDGVPVPKVIDFGIAKATSDQRLTDKTIHTAFEQFIGTPAYMSPEQAEMSGLDIDTRSDIYSLGVLLYELLTSRTPFDAATLLKAGLDQMRRIIREQEPQRPSTRLSTLEDADLTSVALRRRAESPKLIKLICGDLDWIVMKSLEKDRTRRYETANGLALDIHRHLSNEPVAARPPSNLYRFQKLVRRKKLVFASASAVAVTLIFGMGLSMWSYHKEKEARRQAVADREQAARTTVDLLRARADIFARQGKWGEAAADLKHAIELDPSDLWDWFCLAPLLVEVGDLESYELHCQKMLARFRDTNQATNADRIAKACLLTGASRTEVDAAATLADKAVELGEPAYFQPYFHVTKGLAAYRRGQFAAALDSVRKGLVEQHTDPNIHSLAYALLAMSQFRLNEFQEAKKNLAKAIEIQQQQDTIKVKRDSWQTDYWHDWWHDWLITQIVLREARSLIENKSTAPEPAK